METHHHIDPDVIQLKDQYKYKVWVGRWGDVGVQTVSWASCQESGVRVSTTG